MALEAFLRDAPTAGKPAERVEHLIGSLASGSPEIWRSDIVKFVLASLKHGR